MYLNVLRLLVIAVFLAAICNIVTSHPITSPQDVEAEMRQTPQTHCLRFRKFDMIRRCRRYRKNFQALSRFLRTNKVSSVPFPRFYRYRVRRHR